MTAIAIFPLVIALLGLVGYIVSSNPKVAEIGRIAFACGLLVTCAALAGHVIRLT